MDLIDLKLLSLEIHILSRQLKINLESLGFKYEDDKKAFVRAENGDKSDTVVLGRQEGQNRSTKEEEDKGVVSKSDKPNHTVNELRKTDLIAWKDEEEISDPSLKNTGCDLGNCNLGNQITKGNFAELCEEKEEKVVYKPLIEARNFNQPLIVSELKFQANYQSDRFAPKLPLYSYIGNFSSEMMHQMLNPESYWVDFYPKSRGFSLAHKVFDESPEPKCVWKSVYANSCDVHFAGYAHKPPKPPDYTNHNSQRNSCIDNITKLTSHTPISRFTNTNVDVTYVVVELNWFQMIAGLFDITEVKIKGKLNGPSVTEVESKSQIGNSFQHITTNEIFCCAYNVFDQSPEPFPSGHTFWFRKPPKPPEYICLSISQANAYSPTSDNTHSCTPNSLRSSKFLLYVPFNNHNHPVSSHKKPTPNRTLQETYNTQLKIIKPCSNKFEAPDWNEQNTAKRELVIAKGIRAWDMRCCSKLSKAYPELELAVWVQNGHGEDVVLFLDESKDMPNKVHNNDIIIDMVWHVVLSRSSKVYTSSKAYLLHHKALNFMLIGLLGPRKSVSFVALLVVSILLSYSNKLSVEASKCQVTDTNVNILLNLTYYGKCILLETVRNGKASGAYEYVSEDEACLVFGSVVDKVEQLTEMVIVEPNGDTNGELKFGSLGNLLTKIGDVIVRTWEGDVVLKIISSAFRVVLTEQPTGEQLACGTSWPDSDRLYGQEYELFFL